MYKKLEKHLKASETQLQSLNASSHQLRATCYGQDRYWRRYWCLPKAGGIFVEGMESAEPELFEKHQASNMDEDRTTANSTPADFEPEKLNGETDSIPDKIPNIDFKPIKAELPTDNGSTDDICEPEKRNSLINHVKEEAEDVDIKPKLEDREIKSEDIKDVKTESIETLIKNQLDIEECIPSSYLVNSGNILIRFSKPHIMQGSAI